MPQARTWADTIARMPLKDPDSILDYSEDWSDWLATGETLSTAVWTVPAGLTNVAEALGDSAATVWVSGGTAGTTYTVSCLITTTDGRTDRRSFSIGVEVR